MQSRIVASCSFALFLVRSVYPPGGCPEWQPTLNVRPHALRRLLVRMKNTTCGTIFLGLCCHHHVGQCIEVILTEELGRIASSCRFALDQLCKSVQQATILPRPSLTPWHTASLSKFWRAPLLGSMAIQVESLSCGFLSHRANGCRIPSFGM